MTAFLRLRQRLSGHRPSTLAVARRVSSSGGLTAGFPKPLFWLSASPQIEDAGAFRGLPPNFALG